MKKNIRYTLGAVILMAFGGLYYQNCGQMPSQETTVNSKTESKALSGLINKSESYTVTMKDGTKVVFAKRESQELDQSKSYTITMKDGTKVIFAKRSFN